MPFQLHQQLQQDCINMGKFDLCRLLLMNDKQFPWFILVPEVADMTEIYQLGQAQRQQLMDESCNLAEQLLLMYKPDKLNIAAIGNLVPQLHIHHIARFRNDKAWPAPIWGKFPAVPYSQKELAETVDLVKVNFRYLQLAGD